MKPSKCSLATFDLTCGSISQLPVTEPKLDLSFLTGAKAKFSVQYTKCSNGRLRSRQEAVCFFKKSSIFLQIRTSMASQTSKDQFGLTVLDVRCYYSVFI